jgi:hypothetical protein
LYGPASCLNIDPHYLIKSLETLERMLVVMMRDLAEQVLDYGCAAFGREEQPIAGV